MSTSDVRSIEALCDIRLAMGKLGEDWDIALQQIRSSIHRAQEHFSTAMPLYWLHQLRTAEQKLSEEMNNLSRQQGNSIAGQDHAVTEAKQRVQSAKRRLKLCEEKLRMARKIAIQFDHACQELSGPIAEVNEHASIQLPKGEIHLGSLIEFLQRYAETSQTQSVPNPRDLP